MNINSKILGTGGYVPPKVVTNHDLEKMMDTSNEWIISRSGIETRCWVDDETSTSDLAYEASIEAIKNSGINSKNIDLILVASISGDADFPGVACFLQDKLGLNGIATLDIRQQCSGFVYGMVLADNFIKCGQYKNILFVGAEIHSKGLDKTTEGRDISVLFGDGAGAIILSAVESNDSESESCVLTSDLHSDGKFAKELWMPAPGNCHGPARMSQEIIDKGLHFPYMNGKVVFVNAVRRMSETVLTSLKKMNLEVKDVDLFLFHQANLRINQKVADMLKIAPDNVFNTIQKYGNTTAATIPIGLNDAVKAGKLKRGDLVVFAAFGSGFTWGSVVLRY